MADKNIDKTENFKQRVIEKFGDYFILNKVKYINSKTHVTITCPIHGDFDVTPNNFLTQSKGCPKCVRERIAHSMKRSLEDVVEEAKRVHKGKYSYEDAEYNGMDEEMTITCPIHGNFKQMVSHHLRGHGCPRCEGCNKKTTEEFKEDFIKKFGNDFDLSKVEYKGNKKPVTIICPKHGEFEATPNRLLSYSIHACPKCALEKRGMSRRKPFAKFLEEARAIHGDKYIYDESTYSTTHEKMKMTCKECGLVFWQEPHKHTDKEHNGCPRCARRLVGIKCRKPYDVFLEQARAIHGDKYEYHDDYVNARTPMRITCPIHGDFYQRPLWHTSGRGCPICSESHLEREVRLFLTDKGVKFSYEKHFPWLGLMSFDFYLPDYNVAIECQGKQHFGVGGWIKGTDEIMVRDKRKFELASKHDVKLMYLGNPSDIEFAKGCDIGIYNEYNLFFSVEELFGKING